MTTLKRANNLIADILDEIRTTNFFQYFKVNLDKECSFWYQEKMCTNSGACHVTKCEECDVNIILKRILNFKQIPEPWREEF